MWFVLQAYKRDLTVAHTGLTKRKWHDFGSLMCTSGGSEFQVLQTVSIPELWSATVFLVIPKDMDKDSSRTGSRSTT